MKKHLLTLITVVICLFLFAVVASAETYTVSSNDEYETAYATATSGDTIIIDSKLTCNMYANKSLAYVLKADWESSKLVVDQPNVEVSFIADGGDYKILPTNYSTTEGWLNISTVYENVVINLGGINGGTVTIDGSNATHDRVTYAPKSAITLNLLSGSAIANFDTKTGDADAKASILYAKTVNMYDGCQIYGNKINDVPLIKSNDFNLYGGEIFGNLLASTRYEVSGVGCIYAYGKFSMYGGKLYGNIFNAKNGPNGINVVGFISVSYGFLGGEMVIYGGEIGENYVSGTGNEISAMFGINVNDNAAGDFYYSTAVKGTRYIFTDTPVLSFDEETGKTIWQVSNYTLNSSEWYGWCWRQKKIPGDKAAVFLNAQKKSIAGNNFDTYTVINACIEGAYVHSGSNKTIAIPSGYTLWTTDGNKYCHTGKVYTLDEVNESSTVVYYSAYNAERETVDGTTMCSGCKTPYTCSNPSHDLQVVSISYENYMENGIKVLKCNTCDLEKASEAIALPLFTCLGYSIPADGREGLVISFMLDNQAIDEYTGLTGKTFKFGAFAASESKIGNDDVVTANGQVAENTISADITDYNVAAFDLVILGFSEEYRDLSMAMGAYVIDGDTVSYMQAGKPEENEKYYFASYNEVLDLVSSK